LIEIECDNGGLLILDDIDDDRFVSGFVASADDI